MNNKTISGMTCMLYLFGSLMATFPVHAASFDCAKVRTKVKHMICDNPEISKLDEELSAAYKTALQDEKQADAIKQAQRQWMKERDVCVDVACVKGTYGTRLSSLMPGISAYVASSVDVSKTLQPQDVTSAAIPTACTAEDQRDGSSLRVQDIAGLYSQSVEGLPAYIGQPGEKLGGYNYLAITPLEGNQIRVRLSTKEINGHDCGFDSKALLCGQTIRLVPNEEERSVLEKRKLPIPNLRVAANQIAFIPYANGAYVWGSPYCGAMGYLRHSFSRDTRKLKFDDAIFNR